MGCSFTKSDKGQLFALIGFVPGALGDYLNDLRGQLVSACRLKSHVTLLPPRVLTSDPKDLSIVLSRRLVSIEPFEITLGEVEVFPGTGVVYVAIARGEAEMRQAHAALGTEEFAYQEPYPYHPHLTLAQDFPSEQSAEVAEHARAAWSSWRGPRSFDVNHLSFVQGANLCTWQTVSEHDLRPVRRLRTA